MLSARPREGWVLGEGAASLLNPTSYGVWGSAVSSPSRVRGGASENFEFGAILGLENRIRTV